MVVLVVVFFRKSAHSRHHEPFGVVAVDARVGGVVPEAAGAGDVAGAGAVVPEVSVVVEVFAVPPSVVAEVFAVPPEVVVEVFAVPPEVFAVDAVNFVLSSFTDFSNHSFSSSFLAGEGRPVVRGTTASGVGGTKSVRANVGWAVVTSCCLPVTPHPTQMVGSSLQSGHGFVCSTPGRAGQYAKDASGMLQTMHSGWSSRSSRSRLIGVP